MPASSTIAHPSPPTVPDDLVALCAVDETGTRRTITRRELADQVDRASAVMRRLGVRAGDRVALQLPVIPEAVVALLACTRIGAVATTLNPWTSLRDHPSDELALRRLRHIRLLVTTDDQDPAASRTAASTAPPALLVRTGSGPLRSRSDDQQWWHHALAGMAPSAADPAPAPEEHATALRLGLLGPTDVYWCAADLDWLVRHPAAVTGPLAVGAAQVLCADVTRLWETAHTSGVTVLHARPDALHDVLWRSRLTDPHTPDAPDLRRIAAIPDADAGSAPDYWYWQREHHLTATWQLRCGSNPWSPPLAGAPTDQLPVVPR
ncbi:AMP-binding protein [Kitasatospora aureofaciens]|uniref:AMP-binding protein n=1 Tax=Kitasatospora aureofaciens TaxID=1894 RepID=UPI003410B68C